jgi:oligoendopeptidase F
VIEATQPLGSDYQDVLREVLLGGWVDWAPNQGKREACSPCYDVHPYISVAYRGDLRSLSALAHEGGHALHYWMLARHNPFASAQVGPFLAEIASKTQEFLLAEHMAETAVTSLDRAQALLRLVNLVADGFYWNSQLTELESVLRQHVEEGAPLDAERVRETHAALSRRYLGPKAAIDDDEGLEALVIPHMYLGFYNYTYATGTIAAIQFASVLRRGGEDARVRYLDLLKTGTDVLPWEALLRSGVDLSESEPFEAAARWLGDRVSRLDALLDDMDGDPRSSPAAEAGTPDRG